MTEFQFAVQYLFKDKRQHIITVSLRTADDGHFKLLSADIAVVPISSCIPITVSTEETKL